MQKGHFPYEYIDDLQKLEEHSLPPQAAFFCRLKNEGISDTDYALCQEAWRSNRMTTMRDVLFFYNNRDVVPFLECIDQQFAFYQQQNIDMFKDGISVPGLTLLYLFNDLPPNMFFIVFNQTNKDLHHLVKDNIVGGLAIIFSPPISREECHKDTCWRDVSISRVLRRQRAVLVGLDAGYARVDVKRNSSNHNKPSRMDRWLRNG